MTETLRDQYNQTPSDGLGARPIFILCPARSGSTLLQRLVDHHPQLYGPPETNLVAVIDLLHEMCQTLHYGEDSKVVDDLWISHSHRIIASLMDPSRIGAGAERWCDKSLTSARYAETLLKVFPTAQFICLYRNCADVIQSCAETSRWGFGGNYGFEPYVQRMPANFVEALAAYWVDTTQLILNFETAHPECTLRVRYEDLVGGTDETLERIWSFLEVPSPEDETFIVDAVRQRRSLGTRGDHKVSFTTRVQSSSVGAGGTVPIGLVPEPLAWRANEFSQQLGYPPLGNSFEVEMKRCGTVDASAPDPSASLFDAVPQRLSDPSFDIESYAAWHPIRVELTDTKRCWVIRPKDRSVAMESVEVGPEPTVIVSLDNATLRGISDESLNLGACLRRGVVTVGISGEVDELEANRHVQLFHGLVTSADMEPSQ